MIVGCGCCHSTCVVRLLNCEAIIGRLRCRELTNCHGIGVGAGTDIGEVETERCKEHGENEYFDVGQERSERWYLLSKKLPS